MSSDPSPHHPTPVAPPAAAEVDPQPQPAEPPEVMYRTRTVDFLGRRTPIVYQSENGPCPLLAICNVLLLKNVINLNPDASEVSQKELLNLVYERLICSSSTIRDKDQGYVCNREKNITDAIGLLPQLTKGLNVNLMFRKVNDFESTKERLIFDLLDIPLYHGWIVDPQDTDTAAGIGSNTYNTLVSVLAEFKHRKPAEENKYLEANVDFAAGIAETLKIPSPSVSRGRSFDDSALSDSVESNIRQGDREEEEELMRVLNLSKAGLPVRDGAVNGSEVVPKGSQEALTSKQATEHQWELIDNFLQITANQLTVHGLFCLQERLKERELCVFFRNNHFNTMFKYKGSLYLLATDEGFLSQTDLVWQKLDQVNGDGIFFTSNFIPFQSETPTNHSWDEQQAMTSTADHLTQFDTAPAISDLELAVSLQQKEFEGAAVVKKDSKQAAGKSAKDEIPRAL